MNVVGSHYFKYLSDVISHLLFEHLIKKIISVAGYIYAKGTLKILCEICVRISTMDIYVGVFFLDTEKCLDSINN